ncbi:MAG: helix-turn-helix domain-containing protein [Anaerolineales bacterium]|nr:helix-turn-helix domain-containing protein [Anaerolineales bacterium]
MSLKEQKRLHVLNQIEAGEITVEKGAELLGVTERHLYRLKASYREHGAQALAHGNRGRPSPRRLPEEVSKQVVELVHSTYRAFNDHHLTEMLKEHHGIQISRSSVRRLRREAGVPSPRKRRAPKHRSRRPRYPRPGMLLQIDGSEHPWLGDRGPWLTLVAAIDDATGEVPEALFRAQEDAAGYFLLTRGIVERLGLPLAYYADRHSIFRSPKQASVEQQLAGEAPRSQFGRLLENWASSSSPATLPRVGAASSACLEPSRTAWPTKWLWPKSAPWSKPIGFWPISCCASMPPSQSRRRR